MIATLVGLSFAMVVLLFATFVAWDVARRWVDHKRDEVILAHRTDADTADLQKRLAEAEADIRVLQRTPAAVKAQPSLAAEMRAASGR